MIKKQRLIKEDSQFWNPDTGEIFNKNGELIAHDLVYRPNGTQMRINFDNYEIIDEATQFEKFDNNNAKIEINSDNYIISLNNTKCETATCNATCNVDEFSSTCYITDDILDTASITSQELLIDHILDIYDGKYLTYKEYLEYLSKRYTEKIYLQPIPIKISETLFNYIKDKKIIDEVKKIYKK